MYTQTSPHGPCNCQQGVPNPGALGFLFRGMGGLGLALPSPAAYSDFESFLDAAYSQNGVAACETGTYTGCPDISLFDRVYSASVSAWAPYEPAPTSGPATPPVPASVTVAPAAVAPAASAGAAIALQAATSAPAAPVTVSTPARVVAGAQQITTTPVTSAPAPAPAPAAVSTPAAVTTTPAASTAPTLTTFPETQDYVYMAATLAALFLPGWAKALAILPAYLAFQDLAAAGDTGVMA